MSGVDWAPKYDIEMRVKSKGRRGRLRWDDSQQSIGSLNMFVNRNNLFDRTGDTHYKYITTYSIFELEKCKTKYTKYISNMKGWEIDQLSSDKSAEYHQTQSRT